jgi:hypothetical protein
MKARILMWLTVVIVLSMFFAYLTLGIIAVVSTTGQGS